MLKPGEYTGLNQTELLRFKCTWTVQGDTLHAKLSALAESVLLKPSKKAPKRPRTETEPAPLADSGLPELDVSLEAELLEVMEAYVGDDDAAEPESMDLDVDGTAVHADPNSDDSHHEGMEAPGKVPAHLAGLDVAEARKVMGQVCQIPRGW